MKCESLREAFVQELYGELPENRVRELESHRADCRACAEYFRDLKATHRAVDAAPDPEPSAASLDAIRAYAARELAAPEKKEISFPAMLFKRAVPLAAAAAVVVMLGTGLLKDKSGETLYAWDGLSDRITAMQDEVDVLEWEINESGTYAAIDRGIMDLETDLSSESGFFDTF